MILVHLCQNNYHVTNFTNDYMSYNFEVFSKKIMYAQYLTESMRTDWLQKLDEFWDEVYKTYSGGLFLARVFFQYYNELNLGESIESVYHNWKSKQHRLIPKYEILALFVPLEKHYHVTYEEDDKPLKVTCQRFNGFVTRFGRSRELIYITSILSGMFTLGPYPKELVPEISTFGGLP